MKKSLSILILSLFVVPAIFWPVLLVRAANVTATENFNVTLTSPSMTLVVESGSNYDSMTVDTTYVEFVIPEGSYVKLISNDRYTLTNTKSEEIICTNTFSYVHYYVDTGEGNQTIRFTPSTTLCGGSAGGASTSGGGGGGGAGTTTPAEPTTTSQAASKTVNAAYGGSLATSDARAKVTIPVNLVSGNISISIDPKASSGYSAPAANYKALASQVFDFSLTSAGTGLTEFSSPVTLTFKYTAADTSGINEDTLKVYWWNNNKWQAMASTVDKSTKTVRVEVNHFSVFGLFGKQISSSTVGGDLIKLSCTNGAGVNDPCRGVYYLGSDSKRYVFPNESTFYSWYLDFSNVKEVSGETMASYQIGGNVAIRPGTYLVKITTDPKVYAVEPDGLLRWVNSEEAAQKLYGSNWNKKIVDVPDTFFLDYDSSQATSNPVTDKHPVGSLIKDALGNRYYIAEGGVRRLFVTDAVFTGNGFRQEFVLTTDIIYSDGESISATEAVLKTTAGP